MKSGFLAFWLTMPFAIAGCSEQPISRGAKFDAAGPGLSVSVQQLATAYDENEATAQSRYGDKRLFVSAMVEKINLDASNKPFVNLVGDGLLPTQMKLDPEYESEATALQKGQRYTFDCLHVKEMLGTPMLSECRLLN